MNNFYTDGTQNITECYITFLIVLFLRHWALLELWYVVSKATCCMRCPQKLTCWGKYIVRRMTFAGTRCQWYHHCTCPGPRSPCCHTWSLRFWDVRVLLLFVLFRFQGRSERRFDTGWQPPLVAWPRDVVLATLTHMGHPRWWVPRESMRHGQTPDTPQNDHSYKVDVPYTFI